MALGDGIPAVFEAVKKEDLPFPPEVVEGITEEDVDSLNELFCIQADEHYSTWAHLYFLANNSYGREKARKVVRELRQRGFPMALSFFLLMQGTEAAGQYRFAHRLEQIEKGRVADLNDRTSKASEAIATLAKFIKGCDRVTGFDLVLSNHLSVRAWAESTRFLDLLEELDNLLEKGTTKADVRDWSEAKQGKKKEKDIPDDTHKAYDALVEAISKTRGSYYGAATDASRLFYIWFGLDMKPGTRRQKKKRQS